MSKIGQLSVALRNPALLTTERHIEALNALLLAGNNISSVRHALMQHQSFWKNFEGLEVENFYKDEDALLEERDLPALIQDTAHTRVLAGLKSAPEAVLAGLIEAADGRALRVKIAANLTNFGLTIPDENRQNFIRNEIVPDIQMQAQKTLLEKKIKQSTQNRDPQKILALLNAIDAGNNDEFIKAVKDLTPNISPASAAEMSWDGVGNLIKSDLAVECFLLNGANEFNTHYSIGRVDGKLNVVKKLQKDDVAFVQDLPDPYKRSIDPLKKDDINVIRGVLGEHYLKAYIAQQQKENIQLLTSIARSTEKGDLQYILKEENLDPGDKFLKHSVNDGRLQKYRHYAADRLLALKIAEGVSTKSLSMLADMENYQAFLTALDVNTDLGFAGDANRELRNAFVPAGYERIKVIIKTAAHIALNLRTGDIDKVSDFIADQDPNAFAKQYNTVFQVAAIEKELFEAYFNNPENLARAREQALVTVIKSKLVSMRTDQVAALAKSPDPEILKDHVAYVLGNPNTAANDLITDVAKGVGLLLLAHAKAEQIYREALDYDLDEADQYDLLLKNLNELSMDGVDDIDLIKTLPLPDQYNFQIKLATFLAKSCPADKIDSLNELARAKNTADFKSALVALGVTQNDWVNTDSMEAVQKSATARALALEINKASPIGAASRPELLKLLSSFPLSKQQALLARPDVIPTLLNATVPELGRILNVSANKLSANKALNAEYDRIILSKKIDNASLATILARLPFVELDEEKVNAINEYLTNNKNNFFENEELLDLLVNKIKVIIKLKPANIESFNEAFGVVEDINDLLLQHRNNNKLFEAIDALNPNDPKIPYAHFFASLSKEAELTTQQIENNLWDAFERANSRDELIRKIDNAADPLDPKLLDVLKKELTHEKYSELKRPFIQATFLDTTKSTQLLKKNEAVLKAQEERFQNIARADQNIRKELKELAKLEVVDWLNPAFQVATKQNAKALGSHFEKLAETCDIIVDQFKHQKDVVNEQLSNLPGHDELQRSYLSRDQKLAIKAHKEELLKQNKEIEAGYALYSGVQKVLNGSPDSETEFGQKGILQILEEAKEPNREIKFLGYASTYIDYPMDQKAQHLANEWKGKEVDSQPTVLSNAGKRYETAPDHLKVKPDFFREYTIGQKDNAGHFIEERGTNDLAPTRVDGKVEYKPSVKLTMNKFPVQQADPVATHNARVEFCMAMAAQLLASVDKSPSEKEPIVLSGSDPVKLRYLWTALMATGVSSKAIKVVSTAFNPGDYLKLIHGYNDKFEIAQNHSVSFRNHPAVKNMQKALAELKKDKSASQSEFKGMADNLTKIYKETLKDSKVLKETADDNATRPSTTKVVR